MGGFDVPMETANASKVSRKLPSGWTPEFGVEAQPTANGRANAGRRTNSKKRLLLFTIDIVIFLLRNPRTNPTWRSARVLNLVPDLADQLAHEALGPRGVHGLALTRPDELVRFEVIEQRLDPHDGVGADVRAAGPPHPQPLSLFEPSCLLLGPFLRPHHELPSNGATVEPGDGASVQEIYGVASPKKPETSLLWDSAKQGEYAAAISISDECKVGKLTLVTVEPRRTGNRAAQALHDDVVIVRQQHSGLHRTHCEVCHRVVAARLSRPDAGRRLWILRSGASPRHPENYWIRRENRQPQVDSSSRPCPIGSHHNDPGPHWRRRDLRRRQGRVCRPLDREGR